MRTPLSTGADLAWVAFYVGSREGSTQWRLGVSGISFKDLGHGPGRCHGAHRVCNTCFAPLELTPYCVLLASAAVRGALGVSLRWSEFTKQ